MSLSLSRMRCLQRKFQAAFYLPIQSAHSKSQQHKDGKQHAYRKNWSVIESSTTLDPWEILSDPNLTYKEIYFTLDQQARNSMLLEVNVDKDVDQDHLKDKLYNFLSERDDIKYLEPTELSSDSNTKRWYIVEFSSSKGVREMSRHSETGALNLRMASLTPKAVRTNGKQEKTCQKNTRKEDLVARLREVDTMSDQMDIFWSELRASSKNLRAKFFLSSLMADFFNWHMGAEFSAIPYGTVMTGFGSNSSDVDVCLSVLSLSGKKFGIKTLQDIPRGKEKEYKKHHRESSIQLFTEASHQIGNHMPGITNAVSISAKIPILLFNFAPLGIDVDVSLDNRSGVQMAWCVNMLSRMDARVMPFMFLVRQWAKQHKLVAHANDAGFDGLTPFMVTSMGLFYLMRVKPGVIPGFWNLIRHDRNNRDDLVIGHFTTKLVEDISTIKLHDNTMTTEELFLEFLDYFRKFDFKTLSLSMGEGITRVNYKKQNLEIRHPLHGKESLGKNCTIKACNDLKKQAEVTLRRLEDRRLKHPRYSFGRTYDDWGLLSIIDLNKMKL